MKGNPVKLTRHARLAAVALVGALALTACGSDENTGSSSEASGGADTACASGTLNAEGSSAQKNAMEEAIASFADKCSGAKVNYNPTGSGAGIKQFNAGQVDFAGSDSALKTEPKDGVVEADAAKARCGGNPAWDLPMVAGPIAVSYNLPGVSGLTAHAGRRREAVLRRDQDLERPGDRRAQLRRPAAGHAGQGLLPVRRVRHHGELPQVPGRLRADRVGPGAREGVARQGGEGREKSAGVARA
jgi:phosphate transport system substrate-binding protein